MQIHFLYAFLFIALAVIMHTVHSLYHYSAPKIKLWQSSRKMKKVVDKMVEDRKQLRRDCNKFLRQYFGIDAKSDYIPPDFKNKAEVKAAILDKFQQRMDELNVSYSQMYG